MKILYISTVFPLPEQSSTIYTDLAEELKRRGHEIFVVASDGDNQLRETRLAQERGMLVLRVKIGKMYDVGFLRKGLTVLTIKYRLIRAIKKYLAADKFDLVLFETPPITIIDVVKWTMNRFKCPSYLMLKDIFPQNGVDLGIIKKHSIVHRYFLIKESKLYRTASYIGCMSEANKQYILRNNPTIDTNKVEIFPNTKKITYYAGKTNENKMRVKYGIPRDCTVAVFGGNMGRPQGIEFLMDIIMINKDNRRIFFLLIGRGTERIKVSKFIQKEGIKNVLLLDALPRQDYEDILTECDIGLIFLNKNFTIPNFPSRVLSYFEYGLPVIAATDVNTDFGEMIESAGAGYWVESGDIEGFQQILDELTDNPEMRVEMGKHGRRYMEENLHQGISADILEKRFIG